MSGETEKAQSAWTVDTLLAHIERRLDDLEKHVDAVINGNDDRYDQRFGDQQEAVKAALASAEKAVAVAEANAEKWRMNANEWRGAMDDREKNLMPRPQAEQADAANAEKISSLASRIDKNEGRTNGLLTIFAIIAAVGVLVAIFMALRRG